MRRVYRSAGGRMSGSWAEALPPTSARARTAIAPARGWVLTPPESPSPEASGETGHGSMTGGSTTILGGCPDRQPQRLGGRGFGRPGPQAPGQGASDGAGLLDVHQV